MVSRRASKPGGFEKDLFAHVLQYKGEEWSVLEGRLCPVRRMLGRQDERWMIECPSPGTDEDPALADPPRHMGNQLVTAGAGEDLDAERTPPSQPLRYGGHDMDAVAVCPV